MTDEPNLDLLRRGYTAYGSGDLDTINELFADDVVWHVAGRSNISGEYAGKEAVFGFFAKLHIRAGKVTEFWDAQTDQYAADESWATGSAPRLQDPGSGRCVRADAPRRGPIVTVHRCSDGAGKRIWR